jgi:hypothetical protein
VLAVALTAGCESEQDAVPLAQSIPVALVLFVSLPVIWVGAHVLLRHLGRAIGRAMLGERAALRLRWPQLTAGLAAAPVVATVTTMWVVGCGYVAVGYEKPTYDIFSWDESVAIMSFFGAFALILGVLSTLVASGLWSGWRRGVIASRCVLGLVVAVGAPSGVGFVWLPALILSFVTEKPEPRGVGSTDPFEMSRVVQSEQTPLTGWAPPGFVGVGTKPFGE